MCNTHCVSNTPVTIFVFFLDVTIFMDGTIYVTIGAAEYRQVRIKGVWCDALYAATNLNTPVDGKYNMKLEFIDQMDLFVRHRMNRDLSSKPVLRSNSFNIGLVNSLEIYAVVVYASTILKSFCVCICNVCRTQ